MKCITVTFFSNDIDDFGMPNQYHHYMLVSGPDSIDKSIQRTKVIPMTTGSPNLAETDFQTKLESQEDQINKVIESLKQLKGNQNLRFNQFELKM